MQTIRDLVTDICCNAKFQHDERWQLVVPGLKLIYMRAFSLLFQLVQDATSNLVYMRRFKVAKSVVVNSTVGNEMFQKLVSHTIRLGRS